MLNCTHLPHATTDGQRSVRRPVERSQSSASGSEVIDREALKLIPAELPRLAFNSRDTDAESNRR
jgi:hypothetical protein